MTRDLLCCPAKPLKGLILVQRLKSDAAIDAHTLEHANLPCQGVCSSGQVYLDALLGGSAQPIAVGREGEGMDHIASIQAVQPLALCQIPQHGNTVL